MLTVADVFGRAIESKDAIGNYSAELYGYGFSLPTATATNAQHGEIAFDGFEDYNFKNQPSNPFNTCPLPAHFKPTEFEACDATVSHTGMYSLVVNRGTSVTRKYARHYDFPIASTSLATYNANSSILISPFSPAPGKDFFLSVWVKKTPTENSSTGGGNLLQQLGKDLLPGGGVSLPGIGSGSGFGAIIPSATQNDVIVTAKNSAGTSYNIGNFKAEGDPVDGWYQVNGKFRVPPDAVSINVEMKAVNGKTWFDDLRIQPFNSVMKTFVYHPLTLRLMAAGWMKITMLRFTCMTNKNSWWPPKKKQRVEYLSCRKPATEHPKSADHENLHIVNFKSASAKLILLFALLSTQLSVHATKDENITPFGRMV